MKIRNVVFWVVSTYIIAYIAGICVGYRIHIIKEKISVPPKPPQVITNNDYWNRIYWHQVKEELHLKFENDK
jgi:hypothetical protein